MISILFLRLVLASTYTIGKSLLHVVKPIFFIGLAMTLAGAVLLLWCRVRGIPLVISKTDRKTILQLALYQVYLPYAIDFHIAQYVASVKWVLIHAATPFVTALLSWLILKEALTLRKCLGLSIGLLGISSIFMQQQADGVVNGSLGYLPEIILVLSMTIYSYSWIIMQNIAPYYHSFAINGLLMLLGGLCSLVSSLLFESTLSVCPIYVVDSFIYLLLAKIIVVVVGFPLYTHLLQYYSVTFLAFSSFLEPLFVALLGWILFAEDISLHFICAFMLLIAGLYIFYKEELLPESLSLKGKEV